MNGPVVFSAQSWKFLPSLFTVFLVKYLNYFAIGAQAADT